MKKVIGKKKSWLYIFTLDNMVSTYSLSFIATIFFIAAHNWLSGIYGEMSALSGITFTLALAAIFVNMVASLYLVWHGLIRLVRK
jgi:hypothetical protein